MRILFSGAPAGGHLYAMLPLARAAVHAGDDVAILTGRTGGSLLPEWSVIESGPSMSEALAETMARTTGDDGTTPGDGSVELFGGVRLAGAVDDGVLSAARAFAPDLIVAEAFDEVGPFVASALGVPYVVHDLTGPIPPEMTAAIVERADAVFGRADVVRAPRAARVNPFPDALLSDQERHADRDRLPIRPAVHTENDPSPALPARTDGRARVLVSLGTVVTDVDLIRSLSAAVVPAGADAIVTTPRGVEPMTDERPHETWLGFAPLRDILPRVDAVVSAGGTGTTLAALSAGVPLVVHPLIADQPWNARRLQDHGVAVVIDDAEDAEDAVRAVLMQDSYRSSADRLRQAIAQAPSAADVLERLRTTT